MEQPIFMPVSYTVAPSHSPKELSAYAEQRESSNQSQVFAKDKKNKNTKDVKPIFLAVRPKWTVVKARKGMQQDLLSVERNFLAWVRTGLTIVALGIALVQIIPHSGVVTKISGVYIVVFGLIVFLYSWLRHLAMLRELDRRVYLFDALGPFIIVVLGTGVAVLGFLLIYLH